MEKFTTANNNDSHVDFIKIHFTYSSHGVRRITDNRSRKTNEKREEAKRAFDSLESSQQSAAFNYI